MSSNSSDTRHIIRPEHFALSPQLLGLELARPSRRLTALLLDLAIVAILAHTGGGFLLALAAAYAFFRFASRANAARSTRLVVRMAGALILFMLVKRTVTAATSMGTELLNDEAPRVAAASMGGAGRKVAAPAEPGLGTAVRVVRGVGALQGATDSAQARRIASGLVLGLRQSGMDDDGIRQTLEGVTEKSAKPWMASVVNAALPRDSTPPVSPDSLAVRYAAALTARDTAAADSLRKQVAAALARDTVAKLRDRMKELRSENDGLEKQVAEAKEAGEGGKGILATLKGLLDDLGIGFGWTGLYFTAFTVLWRGQTPGKRLLGVRVLRLDGKPLTLWSSFERFGGYAAGLVTGLLGFAQVFWDRNRQAIHDKISETVVVRERNTPAPPAPPVPDRRLR